MKKIISILFVILTILLSTTVFANSGSILVLSDIHLDKSSQHKMEFSPAKFNKDNDLDLKSFSTLIDVLAKNTPTKPSAILIMGDIVAHNATVDQVRANEKEVFTQVNQLSKRLGDVPILYVFGNNDSLTTNYGPFQNKETKESVYQVAQATGWVNGFLSTGVQCGKNAFPCLMMEDNKNGYYAAYLQPKLRFLGLNSVIFSLKRQGGVTAADATQELQWLEAQLKEAEVNHESVLIAMHIPPGYNVFDHSVFWVDADNAEFLKIINRYQKTVIGIFASHTHMEEMKIIRDSVKKNTVPVLFVAGLSTSHGNMPSAKVLHYTANDNQSWALTDFATLQFSESTDAVISLNKLYSYNNYYCTSQSQTILDCLDNFNVDKMKKYFSVGNKNYSGALQFSEDVYLTF